MKTTDLFKTSSKKLNEGIEKIFGKKLNLESFDLPKLEDARNKLRTQVYQVRSQSGFNENLDNEALTQAQWMLDTINAEIAERQELIADAHTATVDEWETDPAAHDQELVDSWYDTVVDALDQYEIDGPLSDKDLADLCRAIVNDIGEVDYDTVHSIVAGELDQREHDAAADGPNDSSDDAAALASAGHGSDEDYESVNNESITDIPADVLQRGIDAIEAGEEITKVFGTLNNETKREFTDELRSLIRGAQNAAHMEYDTQGGDITPFLLDTMKGLVARSKPAESAPPTAKGERMVKHIKKGYAKDGELTDKERSIAYATAWKQHNKNESIEGDNMSTLREGEIQQASAIVSAKTMVDRVGRWIEELSGMENDTLLQLGDQIRDEMGAEQAKTFISSVAPAIQSALENLKSTREALATGVRTLTGEEQAAGMLGAEPEAAPDAGDEFATAEPDAMNPDAGADEAGAPEDEFAAAEPAAGGLGDAGRAKRESIDRSNSLLKILAG